MLERLKFILIFFKVSLERVCLEPHTGCSLMIGVFIQVFREEWFER